MISKLLKALSTESKEGYVLQASELPEHLQTFLQEQEIPDEGKQSLDRIESAVNSMTEDMSCIRELNENSEGAKHSLDSIESIVTTTADDVRHIKNSNITPPTQNDRADTLLKYDFIERIDDLEETESKHHFANFTELLENLRPQQNDALKSIHHILVNSNHEQCLDASGFTVDLALKQGDSFHYSRCHFSFKSNEIKVATLCEGKEYAGQPFFPRLIVKNQAHIIENDLRKLIYSAFLKKKGLNKCPFTDTQYRMLRTAYSMPTKFSNARLSRFTESNTLDGIKGSVQEETIKKHFAANARHLNDFFCIKLVKTKFAARYWVEMGFDLEPLPEKFSKS